MSLVEDLKKEFSDEHSNLNFKGNFFQKQFCRLNHSLLSRALFIYAFKMRSYIISKIKIGDNLILDTCYSTYFGGEYSQKNYAELKYKKWRYGRKHNVKVTIYIDNIKIAFYELETEAKTLYDLFTKSCYKKQKETYHKIPYQFVRLIESWCKEIISEFNKDLAEKIAQENNAKNLEKNNAKEKYQKEKELLSKYN